MNHCKTVWQKRIKGTGGKISVPSNVNKSVLKTFDALIEQKEINIDRLVMPKNFWEFYFEKECGNYRVINVSGRSKRLCKI